MLFSKGRYAGAIYLAGYSIECLLKRAVTARHEWVWLPQELETHDLDLLLLESGLQQDLKSEKRLFAVFMLISDTWNTELRYVADSQGKSDGEKLYRQMELIYGWLNEKI